MAIASFSWHWGEEDIFTNIMKVLLYFIQWEPYKMFFYSKHAFLYYHCNSLQYFPRDRIPRKTNNDVYFNIRMHSSRMRTARLLPYFPACTTLCREGVYLPRGVPAWGRVYLSRGLYLPKEGCTCQGVPAQGVYLPGGVPAQGVYLPRGVYLPGGCTCQGVPGQTHACENITFANFVCGR